MKAGAERVSNPLPISSIPFFLIQKNLCKPGPRERSRWEANDTDGKAERPSERERASQSADEKFSSCSFVVKCCRNLKKFSLKPVEQIKYKLVLSSIETHSSPDSFGAARRAFTFYLGNPFPQFLLSLLDLLKVRGSRSRSRSAPQDFAHSRSRPCPGAHR